MGRTHSGSSLPEEVPASFLQAVKPTYEPRHHDQIWFLQQLPIDEGDCDIPLTILLDEGDLCAFAKPPDLVVHAAGVHGRKTFVALAEKMGYGDCAAVHRIDRETSGILLCARSSALRNTLSQAFRHGEVQKMYLAVCKGHTTPPDAFRVTFPIGYPKDSLIRLKLWINGCEPRPAETVCVTLARLDDMTLFACLPKTGRTNQIRIHLSAIGQWIVGDKMYHEDEHVFLEYHEKGLTDWVRSHILFPRHLLHNAGMKLTAAQGAGMAVEPLVCPLPDDMAECPFVKQLLQRASIPEDEEGQKAFLKALFLKLHALDFSCLPEMKPFFAKDRAV